jgi:hypothetical protein
MPIPPRYWWLKRLGAAGVLWLLLLVAVRWWWGWEAERRLQAQIAKYRAAGQPVFPQDFNRASPVPDDQNGAHYLGLAMQALKAEPKEVDNLLDQLARGTASWDAVAEFVDANQEVWRLVRAARTAEATDWHNPVRSPAINMLYPQLAPLREVAKATKVAACLRHHAGNDAEGVELIRDLEAIGDQTETVGPLLVGHLVAIAVRRFGTSIVEHIVADLQVGGPGAPRQSPASREQVQALIHELLDEGASRDGWLRAMCGERCMQLDSYLTLFSAGRPAGGAPATASLSETFLLGPAWKLDTLRVMEFTTSQGQAGASANWPTAHALAPVWPEPAGGLEALTRMLSSILAPSMEQAMVLRFRLLAHRRMAGTALAIRLYEVDHGHRPAHLADLVTDYLAAVPRDPFDATDGELRYRPDAPSPVLYSVSLNGVDEGGVLGRDSYDGSYNANLKDDPFFLNGDRPLAPPAPTRPAWSGVALPPSMKTVPHDQRIDGGQNQEHDEGQQH